MNLSTTAMSRRGTVSYAGSCDKNWISWIQNHSLWLRQRVAVQWIAVGLLQIVIWFAILSTSGGSQRYGTLLDPPYHLLTDGMPQRQAVQQSLVIPCQSRHFGHLPALFESLANQTVLPQETILVLNLAYDAPEGRELLTLDFDRQTSWEMSEKARKEAIKATPNRTVDVKQALQYILSTRMPLSWSLPKVPGVRIFLRSGNHFTGSNRIYGASMARPDSQYISFFDCDDYLHPQRTEYVQKTFDLHPELEALIHGMAWVPASKWDEIFPTFQLLMDYMPVNDTFLWPYETLWDSLPRELFKNEPNGEPSQSESSMWWFPTNMNLTARKPYSKMAANGWLTVKRELLDQVPYPYILYGEDSLFNWRLISRRRYWNLLPLPLGAYLRYY